MYFFRYETNVLSQDYKSCQVMLINPNAYAKVKKWFLHIWPLENWFSLGILWNNIWNSTIWIQIQVSCTKFKNPKIPGIPPIHGSSFEIVWASRMIYMTYIIWPSRMTYISQTYVPNAVIWTKNMVSNRSVKFWCTRWRSSTNRPFKFKERSKNT